MPVDELERADELETPISRKKALKRIGAGALAVWAVPMFASTGGAGARTLGCRKCPHARNCGSTGPQGCYKFNAGDCSGKVCVESQSCCVNGTHPFTACHSHHNCAPGFHCVWTCCSNQSAYCRPLCGTNYNPPCGGSASLRGPSTDLG